MEAQACGLCCLSTGVSAIPELIADSATGRLVPPDDPAALAGALEDLIRNPATRERLGRAGQARVRETFGMETGIDQLAARFGLDAPLAAE
jgi:glycosyltransferase involved in cell wall biosynthesis